MTEERKNDATLSSTLVDRYINPEEESGGQERWLMTFGDLLSLILTFFVLMYSMSVVREAEWVEVSNSLAQELNPEEEQQHMEPNAVLSIEKIKIAQAQSLQYLSSIIRDKFRDANTRGVFELELLEDRLIISLVGSSTFHLGKTALTKDGVEALHSIGEVLQPIGNQIEVYGSVAPEPIDESEFPSHWELSVSRALMVAQFLRNVGYEYKIMSLGRINLDEDNNAATEKGQENNKRRVDIVILNYRAKQ